MYRRPRASAVPPGTGQPTAYRRGYALRILGLALIVFAAIVLYVTGSRIAHCSSLRDVAVHALAATGLFLTMFGGILQPNRQVWVRVVEGLVGLALFVYTAYSSLMCLAQFVGF